MIIETLADLAGLSADGLTLTEATISVADGEVTVHGPARVLGADGTVTATIRPDGTGGLTLAACVATGATTLRALGERGWLGAEVDVDALGEVSVTAVTLRTEPELGHILATAPLPPEAGLLTHPLPLTDGQLRMLLIPGAGSAVGYAEAQITALLAPPAAEPHAVAAGGGLPVTIDLPGGGLPWRVRGADPVGADLTDLAGGLLAVTGVGVGVALPPGLPGAFRLTALETELAPSAERDPRSVSFELASARPWVLVADVLSVDALVARLRVEPRTDLDGAVTGWSTIGALSGTLTLFGLAIDVEVPVGGGPLELSCRPGIELPTFGDLGDGLAHLLGVDDVSPYLPPGIAAIGGVSVDQLAVTVDPAAGTLDRVSVGLSIPDDVSWSLPYLPGLSLESLSVELVATRPLDDASRAIGGRAVLGTTLGECAVALDLAREPGSDDCLITLVASDSIGTPELLTLVGLDGAAFAAALPPGLSPVADLGLSRLDVVHSLSARRAVSVHSEVQLADTWVILEDRLELPELSLSLDVDRPAPPPSDSAAPPSDAPPATTVRVGLDGELLLGGALFWIAAANDATAEAPQPTDGPGDGDGETGSVADAWRVSLELADGEQIVITDLLAAAAGPLSLPAGLPRIALTGASVSVIPATLATTASLATKATWGPSFAGTTGNMANLSMALAVTAADGSGARATTLTVAGSLALAPLPTLDAVATIGPDGTALLGVLRSADARGLDVGAVSDGFAGAGTWSAIPVPAGFTVPGLGAAGGVLLDLTAETLMVFGQASRLGTAALIIQRLPAVADTTPGGDGPTEAEPPAAGFGVAFVLDLTDGFRFADLVPDGAVGPAATVRAALAAIDAFVEIRWASVSLSSFALPPGGEDTPGPYASVARLRAAAAALPTPVAIPAVPVARVQGRGLNVDGHLVLRGGGDLWEMLAVVLATRADAAVVVHATVDPLDPAATVFTADLGEFVLLRTVTVTRTHLSYVARDDAPVTVTCAGSISVPGEATPGQPGTVLLDLTGAFVVTAARASATLRATAALSRPLGMPGIELRSVALELAWTSQPAPAGSLAGTAPARRLTRFALVGAVTVGSVADLTGEVEFRDGVAVLARVGLAGSLGLGELLSQCVGAGDWSATGLPDLVLRDGALVHVPADAPPGPDGASARPGTRLTATVDVLGVDFALAAELTEGAGLTGSIGLADPLELGFATLTGPAGLAGPLAAVELRRTAPTVFSLGFGVDLFGLRFRDGRLSYTAATATRAAVYAGQITYDGTSTALGSRFTLSVEWTEAGGFRITDWPALPTLPDIDLVGLLESIGSGDPCGALGALGIGPDIVTGQCRTSIRLSPVPAESARPPGEAPAAGSRGPAAACLEVDVYYDVSVRTPAGPVQLNPGMDPLSIATTIEAPASASVDDLAVMIVDTVLGGVAGIIQAILDDPAALVELTSAIALERLSSKAIGALICRGADDPALRRQYSERRADSPEDANTGEAELARAAELTARTAEAATAQAAAASAELVFASVAVAVGFFGSLLSAITRFFGAESDEERDARHKRERAEALAAQAAAAVRAKLRVTEVTLTATAASTIRASWPDVPGDQVSYAPELVVSDADGANRVTVLSRPQGQSATSIEVTDPRLGPGRRVTLRVTASIPKPTNPLDRYVGAVAATTYLTPSYDLRDLGVEQVGAGLSLWWHAGATAPGGWRISLTPRPRPVADSTDSTDSTAGEAAPPIATASIVVTLPGDGPTAWSTPDGLPTETPVEITVTATGTAYPVAAVTTTVTLVDNEAPAELRLFFDVPEHAVTLSWPDAPRYPDGGYRVELLAAGSGAAGTDTAAPVILDAATVVDRERRGDATFTDPGFTPGGSVRARVGSRVADGRLIWGEPRDLTLPTLDVPAIGEVRLDRSAVVVVGTPVTGATDYDAALVDGGGQPWPDWVDGYVDQLPGPDDNWPPTAHLGATFADGARVGARMRARNEVCAGPWSDPGTFDPLAAAWLTVRFLPGVGYAFANDLPSGVRIWWTPVSAEVDGYRLTLTDTDTDTEFQPPLTYDVPAATEPGVGPLTDLTVGTTYAVCVQARVGRSFGPPSETIRVRRSPHTPASLTYLGYDGSRLTATWQPADPQGPSYEVELTGPDGTVVIAADATGEALVLEFPPPDVADGWPAGEYRLRLRSRRWDETPQEGAPTSGDEPGGPHEPGGGDDGASEGEPDASAAESPREPWSGYARITRLGGPPPMTGVTRSADTITAGWEPVAGADLYRVELHGAGTSPARLVTPSTSVTLLAPAPATTPETDLRVRVRAENARGDLLPGPWTELTGPAAGAAPYLKLSCDGWGAVRYRTRDHRRPDVGVNTLYNLMNDGFTLEAEVRVDELTGDRPILRVAHAEGSPYLADGPSLLLFLREGHAAFGMTCYSWDSGVPSNPRFQVMTAPEPIATGRWTQLAVTQPYSGPTILYVDGQEVARSSYSATYPGFDVYEVGRSGEDYFTGYLREIRAWKGPRPPADIGATIGQDLRPRLSTFIPRGLGAYWPLRDGSGTTATDAIDANNLTLHSATWQVP